MDNPLFKYIALVKTAEKGSFTRAAQELDYAQSSVSKMVSDLEKEWGMTLLDRSRGGVCLTSAGEQIMPYLRKVLSGYRELEGQICRMNGAETGVVRIGTFSSVAINWLPNIFAALQTDYPGIDYEMLLGDYDEVERWLGEGRVDSAEVRRHTAQPGRVQGSHALRSSPRGKFLRRDRSAGGAAVPFARTQREDRGIRPAGAQRRTPGRALHHMGGFRHHGHGGKRPRRRYPAGYYTAAYSVQAGDTPSQYPVLPFDRPRGERSGSPDAGGFVRRRSLHYYNAHGCSPSLR